MNCSYRILENVHIGLRVRKTKDKTTVAYKNEPITDVYIKDWNDQGFRLQHEAFPTKDNTVWLDFGQLPLNQLSIEMGYIKNSIVFVERLMSGGGTTSMVFLRADTFDYLELLEDKKNKEESRILKIKDLKVGDQVISSLCREGNPMIYLGTFITADIKEQYNYRSFHHGGREYSYHLENTPKHAYFAYPQNNGKYHVHAYPLTNKTVKELYSAADRGKSFEETCFNDYEQNRKYIVGLQEIKIKSEKYWNEIFNTEFPISKINFPSHGYYAYVAPETTPIEQLKTEVKVWFKECAGKKLS